MALQTNVLERALAEGRGALLESEALVVAQAAGFAVPPSVIVSDGSRPTDTDLAALGSRRVVVKVLSPDISHKTELGGVAIVPNERAAVVAAIERMERDLRPTYAVAGFTVSAHVDYDRQLGGELLLGFRWTDDVGPVVTVGIGGVHAEFLSTHLDAGREAVTFAPSLAMSQEAIADRLSTAAVAQLVTGRARAGTARFAATDLARLVGLMLEFVARPEARRITEFEINPVALTPNGPIALDALVTLGDAVPDASPARPLPKLRALLAPQSIAVMGVSERMNPGRVILQNVLREGFPRERVTVVKPGAREIDGVACVPDIASLPEHVDLLVLSVAAAQVPAALAAVVSHQRAESVIVIPGGLGERAGTEALEQRVRDIIREARQTDWGGPVVNGGNCLGIRSVPGRYDTTFIPPHKLPARSGLVAPLALVAQSGAFLVARGSRLRDLEPRYAVSVGNQIDLTMGDYLEYFAADPEVAVIACYVEGFRPLDGLRWLESARDIVADGRRVIAYRAGRTPAGARASRSHTAAVAGDFAIFRDLAESVGVLVADSLADFDDLTRLACRLHRRPPVGSRIGAVTNAGFESVAVADRLGPFRLAQLTSATGARVREVLEAAGLADLVAVQNPLDLTPIADDATYGGAVEAVLADPNVDLGIIGCVPLTPALTTLDRNDDHEEDLTATTAVAARLARLARDVDTPFVVVVDAGALYDPMAQALERGGLPVFRTIDRALRIVTQYCGGRPTARKPKTGNTSPW